MWDGVASLKLAEAQTSLTEANRADLDAREERNFDLTAFEAWFAASADHNSDAYVATGLKVVVADAAGSV